MQWMTMTSVLYNQIHSLQNVKHCKHRSKHGRHVVDNIKCNRNIFPLTLMKERIPLKKELVIISRYMCFIYTNKKSAVYLPDFMQGTRMRRPLEYR